MLHVLFLTTLLFLFLTMLLPLPTALGTCIAPSAARGQAHVVIAGWDRATCFDYIYTLGLTNARVFTYRRVEEERPARSWAGPCGISVEERILLPNAGREASAFYDYATEFYDAPPDMLVFLHGHGPFDSWHTNSTAVASRIVAYYKAVVTMAEISNHMVTLTANPKTGETLLDTPFNFGRKLLFPKYGQAVDTECYAILDRHNATALTGGQLSCCAMFILPGQRIRLQPRELYRDLKACRRPGPRPRPACTGALSALRPGLCAHTRSCNHGPCLQMSTAVACLERARHSRTAGV